MVVVTVFEFERQFANGDWFAVDMSAIVCVPCAYFEFISLFENVAIRFQDFLCQQWRPILQKSIIGQIGYGSRTRSPDELAIIDV